MDVQFTRRRLRGLARARASERAGERADGRERSSCSCARATELQKLLLLLPYRLETFVERATDIARRARPACTLRRIELSVVATRMILRALRRCWLNTGSARCKTSRKIYERRRQTHIIVSAAIKGIRARGWCVYVCVSPFVTRFRKWRYYLGIVDERMDAGERVNE